MPVRREVRLDIEEFFESADVGTRSPRPRDLQRVPGVLRVARRNRSASSVARALVRFHTVMMCSGQAFGHGVRGRRRRSICMRRSGGEDIESRHVEPDFSL